MRHTPATALALACALAAPARSAAPDRPLPVPLTRPELKQSLEDLKGRTPRIPLPALTAEEEDQLGDRLGYEARLRRHYLPGTAARGGEFGREPDPAMSLDHAFKTMLFWIVSRANNCHY